MFTIEQIDDLHARLGSANTLPEHVQALKTLGIERYDPYLADGHSEYFGQAARGSSRHRCTRCLRVAETGQRDTFLQHLRRHEQRNDGRRDVHGPCAERDREVDNGYGHDDYDVL